MAVNVARFMNRERAEYTVEVLTPMFLGGADGHGELRSPPFKNALRYWWRLTRGDLSSRELIDREDRLFGSVEGGACRSKVDVVVTGDVEVGKKKFEIGPDKINPEADGREVSLAAYLGMGPINFNGFCEKAPILPEQKFCFSIFCSSDYMKEIQDALSLFACFGALGSRSRNGWGSLQLSPIGDTPVPASMAALHKKYAVDIEKIVQNGKRYPAALGFEKTNNDRRRALMWIITDKVDTWEKALQVAAEKYMDLRQVLKFPNKESNGVQKRHIMGYPVTKHPVREWGGSNGRMPSQIRIVVRRNMDGYQSYFLHVPHALPKQWNNGLGEELAVWRKLHGWLDKNCKRLIY